VPGSAIMEKTPLGTQTRSIYRGKVIALNLETTVLPNGQTVSLEIARHPGGSAIVAVDKQQRLCLLRQYRHAAGGWIWELPAGKRELDEDPLDTAQRELEEEAGLRAKAWRKLGTVLTTPGFCDEVIHIYIAQELTRSEPHTEDHELLECHWVDAGRVQTWISDGTLSDAKSIIGIQLALAALKTFPQRK